jgi:hypothetical protein
MNPEDYVESDYCEYMMVDCDCCNEPIEVNFEFDEEEGFYTREEMDEVYIKQVKTLGGDPNFLVCSSCYDQMNIKKDVHFLQDNFPYIENIVKEDGNVFFRSISDADRQLNNYVLKDVVAPRVEDLNKKNNLHSV